MTARRANSPRNDKDLTNSQSCLSETAGNAAKEDSSDLDSPLATAFILSAHHEVVSQSLSWHPQRGARGTCGMSFPSEGKSSKPELRVL